MKIQVPAGMLKAARKTNDLDRDIALDSTECDELRIRLEAALRWLSENPIVPTRQQAESLRFDTTPWTVEKMTDEDRIAWLCRQLTEWQRRMFLAPESEPQSLEARVTLLEEFMRAALSNK